MTYENYFRSKAFKQVLDDFKQCEAKGVPCIISSDDYSDLILYYHQNNHDEKAAEIFEKMTNNLALAAKILGVMEPDDRGKILGVMDSTIAAQITKIMDPDS